MQTLQQEKQMNKSMRSEAAANEALQQQRQVASWMQPSKLNRKPQSTAQKLLAAWKDGWRLSKVR